MRLPTRRKPAAAAATLPVLTGDQIWERQTGIDEYDGAIDAYIESRGWRWRRLTRSQYAEACRASGLQLARDAAGNQFWVRPEAG